MITVESNIAWCNIVRTAYNCLVGLIWMCAALPFRRYMWFNDCVICSIVLHIGPWANNIFTVNLKSRNLRYLSAWYIWKPLCMYQLALVMPWYKYIFWSNIMCHTLHSSIIRCYTNARTIPYSCQQWWIFHIFAHPATLAVVGHVPATAHYENHPLYIVGWLPLHDRGYIFKNDRFLTAFLYWMYLHVRRQYQLIFIVLLLSRDK